MRTFNFRARNIGEEKYLSYTMGEDCELDEDVLDYCQDNAPEELIEIICLMTILYEDRKRWI